MKKNRFTEAQIMGVLRQMEGVVPAAELCREHGINSAPPCLHAACKSYDVPQISPVDHDRLGISTLAS